LATGTGVRQKVVSAMLERNHSVGSASVGKVSQVNYVDINQNVGGGSSSLILDEQSPENYRGRGQQHQARVSEISIGAGQNYPNYNNQTNERLGNSDMSLLRQNEQMLSAPKRNQRNYQTQSQQNPSNLLKQKDYEMDVGEIEMGKSYNTPDYKGNDLARDLMDMEMGLKSRKPFTREDFMTIINNTYNEYYGKFRDQYNPDEYLQVVDDEELVKRYGAFLEKSEDNILTKDTMPWLDLGNIPSTHSFMRSESQQVYYIPHNRNPDMVYVRYS
jgi:hypothetical protein